MEYKFNNDCCPRKKSQLKLTVDTVDTSKLSIFQVWPNQLVGSQTGLDGPAYGVESLSSVPLQTMHVHMQGCHN